MEFIPLILMVAAWIYFAKKDDKETQANNDRQREIELEAHERITKAQVNEAN